MNSISSTQGHSDGCDLDLETWGLSYSSPISHDLYSLEDTDGNSSDFKVPSDVSSSIDGMPILSSSEYFEGKTYPLAHVEHHFQQADVTHQHFDCPNDISKLQPVRDLPSFASDFDSCNEETLHSGTIPFDSQATTTERFIAREKNSSESAIIQPHSCLTEYEDGHSGKKSKMEDALKEPTTKRDYTNQMPPMSQSSSPSSSSPSSSPPSSSPPPLASSEIYPLLSLTLPIHMREQSLHVDQEPFSQTVSRSREWVMGQQEKMVAGILLALCHRVDPECQLSARTAAPWQGYDSSKGIIRRKVSKWDPITGRKRPTKPIWFRNRSWHTAASVVKVMDLIHDNLSKEVVSSKRDIFYRDVPTFQCQRRVDVIVEDLACTFETPRSCLNVIAASRSLVYGSIRFTLEVANSELDQDNTHDPLSAQMDNVTSSTSPQAAISYTDFNTLVSVPVLERQVIRIEIHPRTRYVFVIEKEATMSYLISAGFCESHGPCILLTSKGYPDRVSRRLLKRLSDMVQDGLYFLDRPFDTDPACSMSMKAHVARPIPLDIPFLALVDCDPNGIDIYLTYRCGSTQSGYDNADLAVPDLQYLGQLPSDWTIGLKDSANVSSYDEEANADGQQLFNSLIPLTPRDRALLVKRLTKHPFVLATRALHVEISRMLLMNRKSELQSLCQENVRDVPADSSNSRALTPFISYLDQKLKLV